MRLFLIIRINFPGIDDNTAAARGIEIHALSSAAKPISGWTARDGIQNCREACGGHGYLKGNLVLGCSTGIYTESRTIS